MTIDFAGATQTGCLWSFMEFANVNTGGTNGASAVGQAVTNNGDGNTRQVVTLAAFGNADNATYGAFGTPGGAMIPGSGFTEIHDAGGTAPTSRFQTEWQAGNDTTVDAGQARNWGGIAFEIGAAAAAGGTFPSWGYQGGWW